MNDDDTPERVLREILTRSRLRTDLAGRGCDRTLDHIAQGGLRTEPYRLLVELESEVRRAITRECGEAWANWFAWSWRGFKLFRSMGLTEVKYTSVGPLRLRSNWLGQFADAAFRFQPGLDVDAFVKSPFRTWVVKITDSLGLEPGDVMSRVCGHGLDPDLPASERQKLAVSDRTFERWLSGGRIGRLPGGYRAFTLAAVARPDTEEHRPIVDYLAGWLLIAVGIQSMPRPERLKLTTFSPSMGRARRPSAGLSRVEIERACRFVGKVVLPYTAGELDEEALGRALDAWRDVAEAHPMTRVPYGRLRARLAEGRGEDARTLYETVAGMSASDDAYGWEHHACLLEALAYGRRAGRPDVFRHFWDRARRSELFGVDMLRDPSPEQSAYIDRIVRLGSGCLRLVVVHEAA